MSDRILIIDFGSQVTQLIARRVREAGVYCEIHPFNKVNTDSIKAYGPKGLRSSRLPPLPPPPQQALYEGWLDVGS